MLASLFALGALLGGPLEWPLTYIDEPREGIAFVPSGMLRFERSTQPPAGEWTLPELHGPLPIFGLARLGDRELLFILDRKNPEDRFYNRLHFDAGGNRDLTDDPILEGNFTLHDRYAYTRFPVLRASIEEGGRKKPFTFTVNAYLMAPSGADGTASFPEGPIAPTPQTLANPNQFQFHLTTRGAYYAEPVLGGTTYRFLLNDRNANGRFGDPYPAAEETARVGRALQGDMLYIWTDQLQFQDGLPLTEFLFIEGRLHRLRFDTGENKLIMTPVEEPLRPLALAMPVEQILIGAGRGSGHVRAFKPTGPIALPAGSYRLVSYLAGREDDGGNRWFLNALAPLEAPLVRVGDAEPARLAFGEPFRPEVTLRPLGGPVRKGASQADASLGLLVIGSAGERLTSLAAATGNPCSIPFLEDPSGASRGIFQARPPSFALETPEGDVAAKGEFRYG